MSEESKIKNLIREYLLDEGILRENVKDPKIEFGFSFIFPPGPMNKIIITTVEAPEYDGKCEKCIFYHEDNCIYLAARLGLDTCKYNNFYYAIKKEEP